MQDTLVPMHSAKELSVRAALGSWRHIIRGLRVSAGEVETAGKRLLARAGETSQTRLLHALGELPPRQLQHMTTDLEHPARALANDDAALFFADERKEASHGRS